VAGPAADANGAGVGLCTFCHTPHKAQSTRLLWNHTLSGNTFQWDVPSTTGGTTLPHIQPTYQGASVRCLSCHDGTVAIGDVSWFKEGAANGAAALNQNTTANIPGQGTATSASISAAKVEFQVADATGSLAGNHPVAVPFPFHNSASVYNNIPTGSQVDTDEWQNDPTALGIRLFTDTGANGIVAGATAGQTGIECSSCHDPHNSPKSVPQTSDFFLRGNYFGNDTAYICLKCHKK
jgi:hypothetical protein